jgi:hypothetical protein
MEYYLFQPIEMIQSSSSLFEKSKPIDYKHDTIKITVQNNSPDNPRNTMYEDTKPTDKNDVKEFHKEYICYALH